MAGPIPQQALHNALVQEKRRQTGEMERSSKEVLLDEEGIALDDLSHQRSPTTAGIGPEQQRPTNLQAQFQSSTNVAQQGWRRGNATDDLSRRESTNVLAMGKLYQRMGKMSIIPRYILYILPLGILIAVPIVIGALIPKLELGGVRILWIFIWVEVVWVSLWVSKIFAKLLPFFFKHLIGVVSAGTAKYATIISALEVPNSLLAWTFVSFVTFIPIMTSNPTQRASGDTTVKDWEGTLRQILAAVTVIALVYLIQKTFIQFVAVNFHKVSYEERIKKNKASVHILARLYERSRSLFPTFTQDFRYEDELLMGMKNAGKHKQGSQSVSGTATPTMRAVLGGAKRAVNKATTAFGSAAQEITGKQIFQPGTPYNTVVDALATTETCTSLARRLWYSFAAEGEQVVHLQDFEEVLRNPEEAREAMLLFDRDGNGDVNLEEAEMVVNEISKERKSLSRSMRDVDSAIQKLDDVLVVVVLIIAIFIMISFLNSNFATTLATAGTALLSLSFIFAVTCQEILASILFLFYKHPFDVGDRVDINGSRYVVKELSLLFTVFKRLDGTIVQVNNSILNSAWIENVRRSTTMSECIQLSVDFGTSFASIQKLRREMLKFVESNTRDYAADLEVEIIDARGLDKLLLQIVIKHKSNWQNDALRAHRRNKFMCALVQAIRKLGIVAGGPGIGDAANPMHIIRTVGDQPAASSGSNNDSRPNTSGTAASEFDSSFGQRRRMAEDPSTHIDDDRQPTQQQQIFEYYRGNDLDRLLSGTTATGSALRGSEERGEAQKQQADIERGKSFGRRRRHNQIGDLEKGQGPR